MLNQVLTRGELVSQQVLYMMNKLLFSSRWFRQNSDLWYMRYWNESHWTFFKSLIRPRRIDYDLIEGNEKQILKSVRTICETTVSEKICSSVTRGKPCYMRTQSNNSCLLSIERKMLHAIELSHLSMKSTGLLGRRLFGGSERVVDLYQPVVWVPHPPTGPGANMLLPWSEAWLLTVYFWAIAFGW